jgi:geranylgeranyl diphosphate synthase, type II
LADVQWLFDLLGRQGSIDYAAGAARRHADAAATRLEGLEWLAASPHRAVLEGLVGYVHERSR